ncbi:hypothetical protein [Herbiconiux sp.]|uniref:hypothetical protein n=1 Tax=Herbiconiux sp. TaxID=1871186 RepID=UPI0025C2F2BF|nr:hypothetical protein [Herbiconiux sp.]
MFTSTDWGNLMRVLRMQTEAGKINWTESPESTRGSKITLMMMDRQQGVMSATVGNNHFRLGSADLDDREPYFLEVTRSGPAQVTDAIRSDTARRDPDLYKVARELEMLMKAARRFVHMKGRVVEDIISDLDNL